MRFSVNKYAKSCLETSKQQYYCLLAYFVVVVLRPTREFFTHVDVTITDEGLQILTFTRHP